MRKNIKIDNYYLNHISVDTLISYLNYGLDVYDLKKNNVTLVFKRTKTDKGLSFNLNEYSELKLREQNVLVKTKFKNAEWKETPIYR